MFAVPTFIDSRWHIRMTLNKRAETAAAAIVNNIITRKRPLVFLLVEPFR